MSKNIYRYSSETAGLELIPEQIPNINKEESEEEMIGYPPWNGKQLIEFFKFVIAGVPNKEVIFFFLLIIFNSCCAYSLSKDKQ